MSLFGSGVEQALHCLLFLVDREGGGVPSARDLAEFQGVSTSYVDTPTILLRATEVIE